MDKNTMVLRLKLDQSDGAAYEYIKKLPKMHRGYEVKKIITDYLIKNDSAATVAPAAKENDDGKTGLEKKRDGRVMGLDEF